MIEAIDLAGFLTLGLLGGFGHCVGMCSPFVLFVSRRYAPPEGGRRAAFVAQVWYTLGRILTYAVLGALAGALGGVVQFAGALLGLQRAASVVAGGVLVLWAVVALADELLSRHRALVNRLSQVFLLAMGVWFLWTGIRGG